MMNKYIVDRLTGIHQMLLGVHQAGKTMSSSSKGSEREAFVDHFLSKVLTPQFRFGSGDATDQEGRRSGQLDVVVEYPFVPSLPIVGAMPRLYLAEGIAAVLEVKSDVSGQWGEVEATVSQLSPLQRKYGGGISFGAHATSHIPFLRRWVHRLEDIRSALEPTFARKSRRNSRHRYVAVCEYGWLSWREVHRASSRPLGVYFLFAPRCRDGRVDRVGSSHPVCRIATSLHTR